MKRNYISAFLTEGFVLTSSLIVYKFTGHLFGQQGFSEYALARRIISLLLPAVLLGFDIAIPRYTAYAYAQQNGRNPNNYFLGGLIGISITATAVVFILNIFRTTSSFLFFGSASYAYLIPPISFMIIGGALHAIAYNTFRGLLKISHANILMLLNHGVIPLLVLWFFGKNVATILTSIGILWMIISSVAFFFLPLSFTLNNLIIHIKDLFYYGIRRVPVDFIQFAFFALPATLTAHFAGIERAGFVAFGISALGMAGSAFAPISLILLPHATQMISKGDFLALRQHVTKILTFSMALVIIGTLIVELGARPIIRMYLGESFLQMVTALRIIMLGAVPYAIYITMKSVIDAYYVKMVNAINMLIAFISFLAGAAVIFLLTGSTIYPLWAFVVGIYALAGLTLIHIRKICLNPSTA